MSDRRHMPRRPHLIWLLASVARAGHEWSSGDDAQSAAQADRLQISGSFAKSYTHHATALRAHLLEAYDKTVPPSSNRTEVCEHLCLGSLFTLPLAG